MPIRYNNIASVLKAIVFVKENPAGHLYFLPLLFLVFLLFTVLESLFKNKMIVLTICITVSCLAYFFFGDIYLSINPLKGIGFFALGYALRSSSHFIKLYNLHRYMFLSLILFVIFAVGYVNLSDTLMKPFLDYGMQLFGALFIYQLSLYFSRLESIKHIRTILVKIGKYSFDIYLLHEPYILTVFSVILIRFSINNILMNQLILIVSGITIPLLLSIIYLRKVKIFQQYFLGLNK